jgi:hypothetical protein
MPNGLRIDDRWVAGGAGPRGGTWVGGRARVGPLSRLLLLLFDSRREVRAAA